MMRLGPQGLPDLHGLTADVDELTQKHEEHKNTNKIQGHVSLTGRSKPVTWRINESDNVIHTRLLGRTENPMPDRLLAILVSI